MEKEDPEKNAFEVSAGRGSAAKRAGEARAAASNAATGSRAGEDVGADPVVLVWANEASNVTTGSVGRENDEAEVRGPEGETWPVWTRGPAGS